jgi:starch phosphorylase
MIRIFLQRGKSLEGFANKYAVQLNDTHPSIGVAELMRLLVDEHNMDWKQAWKVTSSTFGYTNHTLLPEALEKWSVQLFGRLLPRHLEIIYEINRRFLDRVRVKYPGDDTRIAKLSIVEEGPKKYIRMAHLACVGSRAINGVAELHSRLLRETVLKDFYELWPEKFSNKTNGVTPRRFMFYGNPVMTSLIRDAIGDAWLKDLSRLKDLEKHAEDADFRSKWREMKLACKRLLCADIKRTTGIDVDAGSMFDIQAKRIHEYKRQHLNILHVIALYNAIRKGRIKSVAPRTFIFGGKAAPGYTMAKLMIKLITSVAEVVNDDPEISDQLKVVFFPDFNVKNSQHMYPSADISEQISTAGKEASGTGCMKFAMNGAVTIGTLDGANIEIREEVGPENFFLFGLTAEEIAAMKAEGYNPGKVAEENIDIRESIGLLESGIFSHGDRNLFKPLVSSLLDRDEYMVLADFASYMDCQGRISEACMDRDGWTRMSILNVARIGKFSSDRAVNEYCEDIWKIRPVKIILE